VASSGQLVYDSFVRRNVSEKTNEVVFAAYPGTAAFYSVLVSTRWARRVLFERNIFVLK
jgi:hypothetical protein